MSITGTQLISEVESLAKGAGYRYIYGGTTSAGYDCSGIIYEALLKLGYKNPPRTSEAQWAWIQQNNTTVSKSQLQPGDLVFAQFPGDNASPGHVGIYIGGGNVFSAEDPSAGIGVSTLASWGNAIVGYGRVPSSTTSPATAGQGTTVTSALGGIFSIPSEITGFFSEADNFVTKLGWLLQPGSWLRIGAFLMAMILIVGAILVFTRADQHIPRMVPVPV